VSRGFLGKAETNFLVERREDMREIRLRCQLTGTYAHWLMTSAQGGTFVDLEMGKQSATLSYKVFDATAGPRFFRRWAEASIEALNEAAGSESAAADSAAPSGA
jgi:hypothetical protein